MLSSDSDISLRVRMGHAPTWSMGTAQFTTFLRREPQANSSLFCLIFRMVRPFTDAFHAWTK